MLSLSIDEHSGSHLNPIEQLRLLRYEKSPSHHGKHVTAQLASRTEKDKGPDTACMLYDPKGRHKSLQSSLVIHLPQSPSAGPQKSRWY